MAKQEPYRLPDRPAGTKRPDVDQLRARLAKLEEQRAARIRAGRDGKN